MPPPPAATAASRPRAVRWVLIAALTLAAASRLAYFHELAQGPLAAAHLWPDSDMSYFDAWARRVAAGDWWSAEVSPPAHGWHDVVADQVLRGRGFAPGGPDELVRARAALWEQWIGRHQFYQEPLYAYLAAAVYRLAGPDVRWVLATQLLLGALTPLLLYLAVRARLGELEAAWAALLLAACGQVTFLEGVLLRDSLIVFVSLLLLALTDVTCRRMGGAWAVATGLVLGLALLLKSTFAVFAAGLAVALWRAGRGAALARVVLGLALALTPLVARNLRLGVPPLALNGAGGVNFLIGNGYNPGASYLADPRLDHAPEVLERSQGRLGPTVIETLRTHPGVGSVARLLAGRAAALSHWYGVPDNANFYYYRLRAPVLWLLPLGFGVLLPVALVGLALVGRGAGPGLHLLLLTHVAGLAVFFVRDRFRAPLAVALVPFAAVLAVQAWRWARQRQGRPLLLALAALLPLLLWTRRPLPPETALIRPIDHLVPLQVYFAPEFARAAAARDSGRAVAVVEQALETEPGPEELAALPAAARAAIASYYAGLHTSLADLQQALGQAASALEHRQRAEALRAAAAR